MSKESKQSFIRLLCYELDGQFAKIDFECAADFVGYLTLISKFLKDQAEEGPNQLVDLTPEASAHCYMCANELAALVFRLTQLERDCADSEGNTIDARWDDLEGLVLKTWNLALASQQFFMDARAEVDIAQKSRAHLAAARNARRKPVERSDVVRKLDSLRQENPRLSETQLRNLAAKELGCGLSTIYRRLKKKE